MTQIQMVGSTAIWRIILLHTAMLSLHISVVNFNVQPSINKYQVVITLLSAKKKFTILHSARNAIGSIYPYNLSFDPSVLCPPISVYNSNTCTGQWCKNCYSSKSSRFSLPTTRLMPLVLHSILQCIFIMLKDTKISYSAQWLGGETWSWIWLEFLLTSWLSHAPSNRWDTCPSSSHMLLFGYGVPLCQGIKLGFTKTSVYK